MPKVDRRIRKTKEAIQIALMELLGEKEFEHITIHDISAKADLNRGTLYLHYADKYDLLEQSIHDHLTRMLDYCILSDVDERGTDFVGSPLPLFQYLEDQFLFFSSMLHNKGIDCFKERLASMVRSGLTERFKHRELHGEAKQEVTIEFLTNAFVGVVEWWVKNNMPYPPQEMANQVRAIFETNLSPR
ncbi:TetR/AcrR family transcriptional regulator [Paenibacillus cymbidii]|uniref:TetR/AcrR family transcriptional regulator n=1 Tax=Paenibacillus cymbidii TaxID=1639034 RepID=UPI001081C071|nr:TetR/AcrR family transcriptional regulator [Paenibacillus cymbidii]